MKKRLECQRRPYGSNTSWPADENMRPPMRQPMPGPLMPPMAGHMSPPMTGHMHMPAPSGIPYPWMQRPMTGQWNMDRWNIDMWNPDMEDMEERRDMEYWHQMYPTQTRRIQQEVEHQCDLLDYEGSVMYDEYPDRVSLSLICESVYNALMQNGALGNSGMMSGSMSDTMPGNMSGNSSQNSSSEFEEDAEMNMDDLTAEEEAAGARNYLPIGQIDMLQYDRRHHSDRNDRSLQDLIEVLLYHEMQRRRRRRRRGRSWYFG